MRLAVYLPSVLLSLLALSAPAPASAQVVSYEVEELRRLAGQLEDLRSAFEAQQRKISSLERQVESLRTALRQSTESTNLKLGDAVTREDLKKLANAIEEVDKKRIADRKLIVEEVQKQLGDLASDFNKTRTPVREPQLDGKFYPHTVEAGQYLSTILDAYNAEFKAKGKGQVTLEDIKRANPTININRIYVGQKILIPDPGNKK